MCDEKIDEHLAKLEDKLKVYATTNVVYKPWQAIRDAMDCRWLKDGDISEMKVLEQGNKKWNESVCLCNTIKSEPMKKE